MCGRFYIDPDDMSDEELIALLDREKAAAEASGGDLRLALGEVKIKDYFKVLWKEIRVSLMVGITLAVANFGRMFLVRFITGDDVTNSVILVVSLSVAAVVVVSKTIGCTLPIVAKLLKLDPALMAGPLITTLVDTISLVIYFALTKALIPM